VEVDVLGPVRARVGGAAVELPARQQRVVLALLALYGPGGASTDRLIEDVWVGDAPSGARTTLQTYVSTLRRLLDPGVIETTSTGYRLGASCDVDLLRYRERVARSDLDGAVELWRDEPAADVRPHSCLDALAVLVADEHQAVLLGVLESQVDSRPGAAVARLQALVEEMPYDDRPVALLMRALARSGRAVEAIRAYQTHRTTLIDETGIEPGTELAALEQDILDGAAAWTPSRSTAVVAADLPRPPDNLYVSDNELAERLDDALAAHRLVSLVGPGGAGKTRLALEMLSQRPAGTWAHLDLGEEVDLGGGIAASLALAAERIVSDADDGLVFVDNVEVDVDAAREAVTAFLDAHESIDVLCGSRVRLGTSAERVVRVEPLDCTTVVGATRASQLLLDRVIAAGGNPDDEGDEHIRIAEALDGLPLALELAAPAIAALGPGVVAGSLSARDGVRQRMVGGDSRDRTVEATIAWSWGRLSPRSRRLGAALAGLRVEFDYETAATVAAAVGDCDETDLAEMVELSLLTRLGTTDAPRFRWLHTVRRLVEDEYAHDIDPTLIRPAIVSLMAGRADTVAAGTPHMSAADWHAAIRPDLALHRAAFRWARELGMWEDGIRILAAFAWRQYELAPLERLEDWAAAADREALGPLFRVTLFNALSCIAVLRGDYSATAVPTMRAVEAARDGGHDVSRAEALSLRFAAAVFEGNGSEAAAQFEETERACRECGHVWGLALVRTFMGTALRRIGDPESSAERLEEAIQMAAHVGEDRLQAVSLSSLGRTLWQLDQAERAAAVCQEAFGIAVQTGDAAAIALAGISHGWVSYLCGDTDTALEVLGRALDAAMEMGNRTTVSSALEWMGLIRSEAGDPSILATVDGFTERYRVTDTVDRPPHEAALASVNEALGDELFEIARLRGASMSLDDVIDLVSG